jgi:hypothetical protein
MDPHNLADIKAECPVDRCPSLDMCISALILDSYLCIPVKGKAIPLQAWTGPEGSRRLRLPDFKTIGT